MTDILAYIQAAGALLAAGTLAVEEAAKLVDQIKAVLAKGDPTDADWDALHAYEATNTAILDAKMEGEA